MELEPARVTVDFPRLDAIGIDRKLDRCVAQLLPELAQPQAFKPACLAYVVEVDDLGQDCGSLPRLLQHAPVRVHDQRAPATPGSNALDVHAASAGC